MTEDIRITFRCMNSHEMIVGEVYCERCSARFIFEPRPPMSGMARKIAPGIMVVTATIAATLLLNSMMNEKYFWYLAITFSIGFMLYRYGSIRRRGYWVFQGSRYHSDIDIDQWERDARENGYTVTWPSHHL